MQEVATQLGFVDEAEMHRLIASVDLVTPDGIDKFVAWKRDDGTKDGLLKAFPELVE